MNKYEFKQRLEDVIAKDGKERSLYVDYIKLLEYYAKQLSKEIDSITEPASKSQKDGTSIGFPDIVIRDKNKIIGCIEVKLPNAYLDDDRYKEQFDRYKNALENMLFTNGDEWILYQWDDKLCPQKVATVSFTNDTEEAFKELLSVFLNGKSKEIKTTKKLAEALAKKAVLLKNILQEHYEEENISKLRKAFSAYLIADKDAEDFANRLSETFIYTLFLGAIEHFMSYPDEKITINSLLKTFPKGFSVIYELYDFIQKSTISIPELEAVIISIIDLFSGINMEYVLKEIGKDNDENEAIIHFYTDFMKEYDKDAKEKRGVFYTQKPVVEAMIRIVDNVLEEEYNYKDGIASHNITLLDPAMGSGTFLISALHKAQERVKNNTISAMHKTKLKELYEQHISKNFYGIEIMTAPYIIAHLRMLMYMQRDGYMSSKDTITLQLYLADALDIRTHTHQQRIGDFHGFYAISEQTEKAYNLKENKEIMCILGNPPYNNFDSLNKGDYIINKIEDYEVVDMEDSNLRNDYVKFFRFAEDKIEHQESGILSFITPSSYLSAPTFRGMRKHLLETFDTICIIDLGGDNEKENVFKGVSTPVSIFIGIKKSAKKQDTLANVYYIRYEGNREMKYEMLNNIEYKHIIQEKNKLFPYENMYYMIPYDNTYEDEYKAFMSVKDIFIKSNSGLKTGADTVVMKYTKKDIQRVLEDITKKDISVLMKTLKFSEKKKLKDIKRKRIEKMKEEILHNKGTIEECTYAPFDTRYTYLTTTSNGCMERPRYDIMKHMLHPNKALITPITDPLYTDDNYTFTTNNICNAGVLGKGWASLFPLYTYETTNIATLKLDDNRISNINTVFIDALEKCIGISTTAEDVFYYIIGVLYNKDYRAKYKELIKKEFPRIPLPSSKEQYNNMIDTGISIHKYNTLDIHIHTETKELGIDYIRDIEADDMITLPRSDDYYRDNKLYINDTLYITGMNKHDMEYKIGSVEVIKSYLDYRRKSEIPFTECATDVIKICIAVKRLHQII